MSLEIQHSQTSERPQSEFVIVSSTARICQFSFRTEREENRAKASSSAYFSYIAEFFVYFPVLLLRTHSTISSKNQ